MLQVARLAPSLLLDSAPLVRDFYLSQLNEDGGFKNRAGASDLYYTVFGIEGLLALQAEVPSEKIAGFLRTFGLGQDLDLIHIACLARCWADLQGIDIPAAVRDSLLERLPRFRSADGGFHNEAGSAKGTVYGCFMAFGAYQDLGTDLPESASLSKFLLTMQTPDGGFANDINLALGSTPTTAAAITLLRCLDAEESSNNNTWLENQCHPQGGFLAMPRAPMPDLLSTAVALHALRGQQIDNVKEQCLIFVDTLWTNRGGFYGHWAENQLDCEYTYYGLLALGHLSL